MSLNKYRPAEGSVAFRVCLAVGVSGRLELSEGEIAASEKRPSTWVSSALADPVTHGWLRRTRRPDDRAIVYMAGPNLSIAALGLDDPAQFEAPAPVQVDSAPAPKRRGCKPGTRPTPLPELDVASLPITLKPKANGKLRAPAETKWGALFDRVGSLPLSGNELPTVELPREYGKAIQAAARAYTKARGGSPKFAVSIGASKCVLQRVS